MFGLGDINVWMLDVWICDRYVISHYSVAREHYEHNLSLSLCLCFVRGHVQSFLKSIQTSNYEKFIQH